MPAFVSQAISSQGVVVSVEGSTGTGPPYPYLDLCEIKTFTAFDGTASEQDATTICSEAKEVRMGLQDFGQFSFTANYVPDDPAQMELQAAKAAGTVRNFKFTLPASYGEWAFAAFVKSFPIAGGVDTILNSNVVLRINGAPLFTPGTTTLAAEGVAKGDRGSMARSEEAVAA